MAKLTEKWIVQSHGELVAVADGIRTVEGSIAMPLGTLMAPVAIRAPRSTTKQR